VRRRLGVLPTGLQRGEATSVAAGDSMTPSVLSAMLTGVDFEEFFAAERKPLIRFVRSLGAGPDLAADIAQTAFERALPAWGTIRHPRAWLRRVAQNELTRVARSSGRETPVESLPDRAGVLSAAMDVELRAQSRDVMAALAGLPTRQRQAMAWFYDGFTPAEIARELGDSPAAVRQNLSKARKKLQPSLRSLLKEVT
jgi:RNA polymerase sigma factor (sigma-70 family)